MIEFANPAALWFLTLILPVVLLYLLKRRRQDRIVPSTLLWKKAVEDTQAHTPFQKLRSNLLLLLQILIIVLLTALLAQPYFPLHTSETRQWIIVIDRSASMQSTDEEPNRFHEARKKLEELLDSIATQDEVMLISVGSEASILQNFTLNHPGVRHKLQSLQSEDVAADWDQLLLILKPLLRKSPKPKLIVASDFANFPTTLQSLEFDSIAVGKSGENVGITRAAMENLPDSKQEQVLFFQVKNFAGSARSADLEVRQNQELLDAFEIQLQPGQETEKAIRVPVLIPSRFELILRPDDSLMLDNDFVLLAHPRKNLSVKLEIENPFLKRALEVLPDLEIAREAPVRISNQLQDAPGIYFLKGSNTEVAAIVQWNASSDPLRFVDAGLWRISNYQILQPPAGSHSLLETSKGVVAYAMDKNGRRQIVLGFPLEDSNLGILAGFPIFIANSIEWIRNSTEPSGSVFTGREHPQEGEMESGKGYVNFADAKESELTPAPVRRASASETRAAILRRDFSKWFLLALLAVVILEWWVFHRKEFV
jgi:hypothetical protein